MVFKVNPDKKLGQHFLKDQNVISAILKCRPKQCDFIVEVGPGTGAITNPLIELKLPLLLIEKDKRVFDHWHSQGQNCFHHDALKILWDEFLINHAKNQYCLWLVSNLPYNISAPLTVRFLTAEKIHTMTLMYQKEVANKILATEGMCSLFALCHAYFEIEKIMTIKPGAFHPPPKVDSMVLNFIRRKESKIPIDKFSHYEKFLRHLFAHPRKQLGSVLTTFMPIGWKDRVNQSKIDLQRRAQTLSWDEVFILYQVY